MKRVKDDALWEIINALAGHECPHCGEKIEAVVTGQEMNEMVHFGGTIKVPGRRTVTAQPCGHEMTPENAEQILRSMGHME